MRDDDLPAFPTPSNYTIQDDVRQAVRGMTLRDWFAGQVAMSMVAWKRPAELAKHAYAVADALLEERRR